MGKKHISMFFSFSRKKNEKISGTFELYCIKLYNYKNSLILNALLSVVFF
jgi:hypothetical protein